MQLLEKGYRGLELLVELNVDRFAMALALGGALLFAGYIGTF